PRARPWPPQTARSPLNLRCDLTQPVQYDFVVSFRHAPQINQASAIGNPRQNGWTPGTQRAGELFSDTHCPTGNRYSGTTAATNPTLVRHHLGVERFGNSLAAGIEYLAVSVEGIVYRGR